MSVAILVAFVAGALCLGMLSSLVPLGQRGESDESDTFLPCEGDFFEVGGLIIDGPILDLEALIPAVEPTARGRHR